MTPTFRLPTVNQQRGSAIPCRGCATHFGVGSRQESHLSGRGPGRNTSVTLTPSKKLGFVF